jgi:hypothetical protein
MDKISNNEPQLPSIAFCIAMDLVGIISYAIPGLMEFTDVIWAPLSAFIFMKTFGGKFGKTGAVINFLEEILPGTDIIPTFTIAWVIKKYF